jgi:hypothetical protein
MAMHMEQAKALKPPIKAIFPLRGRILAAYKTARDTWHGAAINSHSSFSMVCPLSVAKGQFLSQKGIYTVSQIMDVGDITSRLTTSENRALMIELTPVPVLQHRLRLLLHALRRGPTVVSLPTTGYSLSANLTQKYQHSIQKTGRALAT